MGGSFSLNPGSPLQKDVDCLASRKRDFPQFVTISLVYSLRPNVPREAVDFSLSTGATSSIDILTCHTQSFFFVMSSPAVRPAQASQKDHTVYTLRFSTGFGRGCGLDVPGAGVQVRDCSPYPSACMACTQHLKILLLCYFGHLQF